jgi:hypothetical protein
MIFMYMVPMYICMIMYIYKVFVQILLRSCSKQASVPHNFEASYMYSATTAASARDFILSIYPY